METTPPPPTSTSGCTTAGGWTWTPSASWPAPCPARRRRSPALVSGDLGSTAGRGCTSTGRPSTGSTATSTGCTPAGTTPNRGSSRFTTRRATRSECPTSPTPARSRSASCWPTRPVSSVACSRRRSTTRPGWVGRWSRGCGRPRSPSRTHARQWPDGTRPTSPAACSAPSGCARTRAARACGPVARQREGRRRIHWPAARRPRRFRKPRPRSAGTARYDGCCPRCGRRRGGTAGG